MILWVDDDVLSLNHYVDEMEDVGYKVQLAINPDEMWKILEENKSEIDGIIMDIMLPTGDQIDIGEAKAGILTGLRLIESIMKHKEFDHLKILIFTILSEQEVAKFSDKHNIPVLKKQTTYPSTLLDKIDELNLKRN